MIFKTVINIRINAKVIITKTILIYTLYTSVYKYNNNYNKLQIKFLINFKSWNVINVHFVLFFFKLKININNTTQTNNPNKNKVLKRMITY